MCEHLNGASLHAERPMGPAPLSGDALEAWLKAARSRRDDLTTELCELTRGAQGLRQFASLRMATLKLAERVHSAAAGDLDRIEERLAEFDRESEERLAETGGTVKRCRARLAHLTAPGPKPGLPNGPEDIEQARRELRLAEDEDALRLRQRAEGRRDLSDLWMESAKTVLDSSLRVLALSEPDRLALEAASSRAEAVREELAGMQRQIEAAESSAQA